MKIAAGKFDLDAWWRHGLEAITPESFVAATWPQLSRLALEPAREGETGPRLDVLETLVTDHERRLTKLLGTLDAAAVSRLLGTHKNLNLPPAVLGRVPLTQAVIRDRWPGGAWKDNLPEVVELKVQSSLDGTEWKDIAAVKDARSWYADGDGVIIPATEPARFWRLTFRHGDFGKGGCVAFQKLILSASER